MKTIGHSSGIMRLLLLGALVGSCGGSATVVTPTPAPIVVTGARYSQSAPIQLSGNYAVTWSATPPDPNGCFQGAELDLVGGTPADSQNLTGGVTPNSSPVTGSTHLYGLNGSYYVAGTSGCASWTYTFSSSP